MSTFRVNKTNDYTVVSNTHLRDKNLSLKAKGLLTVLLSLPDNWDYSVNGLVAISKEGKDGITSAIKELENNCYLKRTQIKDENGKFKGHNYDVYEKPFAENPSTVNPITENPSTENPPQLNTEQSSIKKSSTKVLNTKKNKRETYVSLVDEYTDDEQLREALIYYIDMRLGNPKDAFTPRALELALPKLNNLSKGDLSCKIEIVNQSVEKGWKGFFKLKEENNNSKKGEANDAKGEDKPYKGYMHRIVEERGHVEFEGF